MARRRTSADFIFVARRTKRGTRISKVDPSEFVPTKKPQREALVASELSRRLTNAFVSAVRKAQRENKRLRS